MRERFTVHGEEKVIAAGPAGWEGIIAAVTPHGSIRDCIRQSWRARHYGGPFGSAGSSGIVAPGTDDAGGLPVLSLSFYSRSIAYVNASRVVCRVAVAPNLYIYI